MSIIQKSQKSLEYDKILAELAVFAKTDQSRKLCLDLTPSVRHDDIEQLLKYTAEAKKILDFANDIPIDKIVNFTKIREKNEYFIEEELVEIAKSIRTFRLVKNFLKENLTNEDSMMLLVESLYANKELEDKLLDTFDENNMVRRDANPELNGLYSSLKDTAERSVDVVIMRVFFFFGCVSFSLHRN